VARVSYLILHGWQGSGPDHWQTWLAGRLRERGEQVRYPELPDPDAPELGDWLDALRAELAAFAEPPVVVCHSLACILWLHHGGSERALLVAPPASRPEIADFFPPPLPRGLPAELWCADDDPYCPEGAARLYGEPLGVPVRLFAGGGHLNPDAGYGAWPAVESWASGAKKGVDT
jgi:uncharacterized protein